MLPPATHSSLSHLQGLQVARSLSSSLPGFQGRCFTSGTQRCGVDVALTTTGARSLPKT